jgi:signal transduction histidine kinase
MMSLSFSGGAMAPSGGVSINAQDASGPAHLDALDELRAPLTVCREHLELLLHDPDRRAAVLPMVIDELDRMARLVDNMGVLASAERPGFLRPAPVDLATLTADVQAEAATLGRRRWSVVSRGSGTVVCDPQRVTQAMLAIADNAVRHTEPGSAVVIGSAVGPHGARLWVQDSGPGVPPAEQEQIFERFVRGNDAPARYRGAGLGLAVARTIARAHGGDVELASRTGCGATFTLALPHR